MKQVVIVIPIHNPFPSKNELASFAQCFKILDDHPIKVLAPNNLNLEKYKDVVTEFDVVFIDPIWQSGIEQYNKLKANSFFYNLFKEYKFLLTYELDAWVFRDQLEVWCKKEYDYVGAPWFKDFGRGRTHEIVGVGNSGFSLRNVETCARILKRLNKLKTLRSIWFKSRLQSVIRFERIPFLKSFYKIKKMKNLTKTIFSMNYEMNEDFFWGEFIGAMFYDFKVSPISEAIGFSFEMQPAFLFGINHNQLPFGCHAWEKYEPEFWKEFINLDTKSQLKDE